MGKALGSGRGLFVRKVREKSASASGLTGDDREDLFEAALTIGEGLVHLAADEECVGK
uniref:Methyltransferase type 11 n=1 Tax=mine drainage metagenome TaxID=410659 RepID=E6QKP9_9ZZZZ